GPGADILVGFMILDLVAGDLLAVPSERVGLDLGDQVGRPGNLAEQPAAVLGLEPIERIDLGNLPRSSFVQAVQAIDQVHRIDNAALAGNVELVELVLEPAGKKDRLELSVNDFSLDAESEFRVFQVRGSIPPCFARPQIRAD